MMIFAEAKLVLVLAVLAIKTPVHKPFKSETLNYISLLICDINVQLIQFSPSHH